MKRVDWTFAIAMGVLITLLLGAVGGCTYSFIYSSESVRLVPGVGIIIAIDTIDNSITLLDNDGDTIKANTDAQTVLSLEIGQRIDFYYEIGKVTKKKHDARIIEME